jgi:hypothetical protein
MSMKALSILALLAMASPAFAQVPAEKQTAPVQDKKPFLYDRIMPKNFGPPAPETVAGTTITAKPQPSTQPPKARGG